MSKKTKNKWVWPLVGVGVVGLFLFTRPSEKDSLVSQIMSKYVVPPVDVPKEYFEGLSIPALKGVLTYGLNFTSPEIEAWQASWKKANGK